MSFGRSATPRRRRRKSNLGSQIKELEEQIAALKK